MTTKNKLREKGVSFPNPESVYIGEDIDIHRISHKGVVIHGGCRITGADTLILPGAEIGHEAPVTLENTMVGENTKLHGGFFTKAVFAGENVFGSCAHVRAGTILEEQANAAHSVGLKQTLLFPFVTLGSLINFCDCFMAGGTSRKDHSEVGSSFIHFNYTPNQDKATPSMMGNVSQGVMLDQPPIFLGGQGGIVGPVRLAFGCVTAAGSVIRKDELTPNRLILGGALRPGSFARNPGIYTQVKQIFHKNILYIASLISLKSWYVHVRPLFAGNTLEVWLVQGMQKNLDMMIEERIKRLHDFCQKVALSREILIKNAGKAGHAPTQLHAHDQVIAMTDRIQEKLSMYAQIAGTAQSITGQAEEFLALMEKAAARENKAYIPTIQRLSSHTKQMGSQWLSSIESDIISEFTIKKKDSF